MIPPLGAFARSLRQLLDGVHGDFSHSRRRALHSGRLQGFSRIHQSQLLEQRLLLIEPPGSLTVNAARTGISVTWIQPSDDPAESYQLKVYRAGIVSGTQPVAILETAVAADSPAGQPQSYMISQPLPPGGYTVSVAARGADGSTSANVSSALTVVALAPQFLSISGRVLPTTGLTTSGRPSIAVSPDVALSWNILPGVSQYYVSIARKSGTTYTEIPDPRPRSVNGGTFLTKLVPGDYRIWVRELNRTPLLWSSPVDFTVNASADMAPAWLTTSESAGSGDSLRWAAASNAVRYEVEISGTASLSATVAGTQFRGRFLEPGEYSARVRSVDAADQYSDWSSSLQFSVSANSYLPTLLSVPEGLQAGGVSLVSWRPVNWAANYEVTLQTATGTVVLRERTTSTGFVLPRRSAGSYRVIVRAFDTDDVSFSQSGATFVVDTSTYKSRPPMFVRTEEGLALTWQSFPGAVGYEVWVDRYAVNGFSVFSPPLREYRTDTLFLLDNRFSDGASYRAFIRPRMSDGPVPYWSDRTDFTISPTLMVTVNATQDQRQPRIEWNEFPLAASYSVTVLDLSGTSSGEIRHQINGLVRPYWQLPEELPAGEYSATVQATLPGNVLVSGVSPDFTVTSSAGTPEIQNIELRQSFFDTVVSWDGGQGGYDVRIVTVDSPGAVVLREQHFEPADTVTRITHTLQSGLAPGLYRVDVRSKPADNGDAAWTSGPVFHFNGTSLDILQARGTAVNPTSPNVTGPWRGDFDADGDQDLVRRDAASGMLTLLTNDSTVLTTSTANETENGRFDDFIRPTSTAPVLAGDFNGDGRDDLVQPEPGVDSWQIMRSRLNGGFDNITAPVVKSINPDIPQLRWDSVSGVLSWSHLSSSSSTDRRKYEIRVIRNGTATSIPALTRTLTRTVITDEMPPSSSEISESLADLDPGDYTIFCRTSLNDVTSQWSDGLAVTIAAAGQVISPWQNHLTGDFNGDRRDDIAVFDTVRQKWTVFLSTGTSFEQSDWTSGIRLDGVYSRHTVIDVNGDGRKDLVFKNNLKSEWMAAVSTGTAFQVQVWSSPSFLKSASVGAAPFAVDMNLDGREDLVVWVGGSLRAAFSAPGAFQESSGGVAWPSLASMPVNTVPVDVNQDGRPDLVGFNSTGQSVVSLATESNWTTPVLWEARPGAPWFVRLQSSGRIVVDYDYRLHGVTEAFDLVSSTVGFEAYRGIRKGPEGTRASQTGNAWDQAGLLGKLIADQSLTNVEYATGRMTLTESQAGDWLTTTDTSVEFLEKAGLNPILKPDNTIEFDHAWLRALLPTTNGLNWVTLNPSWKRMLSPTPQDSTLQFTAADLRTWLSAENYSFKADFDAGGSITDHDLASVPPQLHFQTGGAVAVAVTSSAWPKAGAVANVKLETSHATPTSLFVGNTAVNGTLAASLLASQEGPDGTQSPLNFRMYSRATEDYEAGFEWVAGQAAPGRLYERHGDTIYQLATTISDLSTGDTLPFPLTAIPGYMQCHVTLSVTDSDLVADVQWMNGGTVFRKRLSASLNETISGKPPAILVSGRFGIQTAGTSRHFIDDLAFSGKDTRPDSPLTWHISRIIRQETYAQQPLAETIGLGRSIRYVSMFSGGDGVSLNPERVFSEQWPESEYQTVQYRFVGPAGSTVSSVRSSDAPGNGEYRLSEVVRRQIIIRTGADGRSAQLLIDGVLHETATLSGATSGMLRLESVYRAHSATGGVESGGGSVGGSMQSEAAVQSYWLPAGGLSQVLLQAGQYSASDTADASDRLADASDRIPVTSGGLPIAGAASAAIAEKLLAYAAVRLVTAAERTDSDIARLTDAVMVRPGVGIGLISSVPDMVWQRDSVFFARPKDLRIDFPAENLLYVSRKEKQSAQAVADLRSRTLLRLVEMSALEHQVISEISDKPGTSALSFLADASVNGVTVRRLRKDSDGQYVDEWDSNAGRSSNLSTFLNFGSGTHRQAARDQIQQQLDAGGIVTVSAEFRSVNGWTGTAWLHENSAFYIPVIESLLKSDADGTVLRGGVIGDVGQQATSNVPLSADSSVMPDGYQGILRIADTDFSLTIPGLSIPFTRTWTSARSDAWSPDRIVTNSDISGFGPGWIHPFAQQLEITSITDAVVYHRKSKNLLGLTLPTYGNAVRLGEATIIGWRKEDGTVDAFTPNGNRTVNSAGQSLSADYSSPFNSPGVLIRRLDGGLLPQTQLVSFGDFYEVLYPDGAVLRFQDFNPSTERVQGSSTALLISIADRFGNRMDIQRDPADPARIVSITDGATQRILAAMSYKVSVAETRAGGSGRNERQTLTLADLSPGDTFVLSFQGETTPSLPANAGAAAVQSALQALKAVGSGNISVSGNAGGPFTVDFIGGLAQKNVRAITTLISGIEIPAAPAGSSPTPDVSGSRYWNYEYDAEGNLSGVSVSDSPATDSSAFFSPGQLIGTTMRHAYTWHSRLSIPGGDSVRGDRLARLLKSASTFGAAAGNVNGAGGGTGGTTSRGIEFATEFKYFGNGRLRSIRDASGATTRFLYSAFENQTWTVDALGRQSSNRYSDYGFLTSAVTPDGARTDYQIDEASRRVSRLSHTSGVFETWGYDGKGNIIRHTDTSGLTQISTFHPQFNQLLTLDEHSATGQTRRVLTNTYYTANGTSGARGALATSVNALGKMTRYFTTPQGLLAETITPKGHSTAFNSQGYDAFGSPVRVSYRQKVGSSLSTMSFESSVLDNTGQLAYIQLLDAAGVVLRTINYEVDLLGRTAAVIAPGAAEAAPARQTHYFYGEQGLLVQREDADGAVYRFEYDASGRQTREIRPDGTFTETQYNADGTVKATTDPNGNRTRYLYDAMRREVQAIRADGSVQLRKYDARGNLVRETDERGHSIQHEYNLQGRLISTTDAAGIVTLFSYDEYGNLRTTETTLGTVTHSWNALRQITQTIYESRDVVGGVTVRTPVRADRFFYDANGNQEKTESIDLRFDETVMPSSLITTLTDDIITAGESAAIHTSRRRTTSQTYSYRDTVDTSTNAAQKVSRLFRTPDQLLSASVDARGSRTELFYNPAGELQVEALPFASDSDAYGLARVFRRDAMGRVLETVETAYFRNAGQSVIRSDSGEPAVPSSLSSTAPAPLTRTTRSVYDALGRVVAAQDALGYLTRFRYDPAGNAVETIDPMQRSTLNVFDSRNRVIRQVLPAIMVAPRAEWLSASAADSAPARFQFPMTSTVFDSVGNVIEVRDPAGVVTEFQYDERNLLIRKSIVSEPSGADGDPASQLPFRTSWMWTYDSNGNVSTETDPLLRTTHSTSDLFGRVRTTTRPDPDGDGPLVGTLTQFTFDAFGNLVAELDTGSPADSADDRLTRHEYNSLNLRTRTILPDPDGIVDSSISSPVSQWSYDETGNLISETDALNRVTSYTWDRLNRQTKTQLPSVSTGTSGTARPTSLTTYDLFGGILTSTDAAGRVTRFQRDLLGRTTMTIMPHPDNGTWSGRVSASTESLYDASGNVLRLADQTGRETSFLYDSLNRVVRSTKPDPDLRDTTIAPSETTSYDIRGNVAESTDALGRVTRRQYDAQSRPVLVAVQNDGPAKQISGWNITSTIYDRAGNATAVTDPRGYTTHFAYNDWNLLIRRELPAADENGRPTTMTSYDQAGNVHTVTDARGGVTISEYDRNDRLVRQVMPDPGYGMTRPEVIYVYDAVGNRTKEQTLIQRSGPYQETWTETVISYDALNRAVQVSRRSERLPEGVTPIQQTVTSNVYDLSGNLISSTDGAGRVTQYEYDRNNRQITEIRPKATISANDLNPVTRRRYDSAGNLASVTDPLGRITSWTYDRLNRVETMTSPDPDGHQGPLPAPSVTSAYDAAGNVLSTTDQTGRRTISVYDAGNRVVSVTQPDPDPLDGLPAPVTRYAYDSAGNRIRETDAAGNVTDFEFDALNRLRSTTLPDASVHDRLGRPVTRYSYDLSGNLIRTTNAVGHISEAGFDGLGRRTEIRDPDPDGPGPQTGKLQRMTYDAVGNLLSSTEEDGAGSSRTTWQIFDYLNRLSRTIQPAPFTGAEQLVTEFEYDAADNRTAEIERSSLLGSPERRTTFTFDRLNRLTATRLPDPVTGAADTGPISTNVYDLAGRLLAQTDSPGRTTTFSYDDLDRRIRTLGPDPDGLVGGTSADTIPAETLVAYDASGNIRSTMERRLPALPPAGASTATVFSSTFSQYDQLDRLTSVTDPNGAMTQYRYDVNGNRTQLTDPLFNTTRWQFDRQNQMTAETDPLGLSTVYEYDIAGQLWAVTDRRRLRTEYKRDSAGQATAELRIAPAGTGVTLVAVLHSTYDGFGRLTASVLRDATTSSVVYQTTQTFDALDQLTSSTTGTSSAFQATILTYQYDVFGNRLMRQQQTQSVNGPVIVTTQYTGYDSLDRPAAISQTASPFAAEWQDKSVRLAYRADSSLQTIERFADISGVQSVVRTEFVVDSADRLKSLTHYRSSSTELPPVSYQYRYLADGRQQQEMSSLDGSSSQTYDAAGQLKSSVRGAAAEEAYVYDSGGNRLLSGTVIQKANRIENDGTSAFQYDAEGNLTRRIRLVDGQPVGASVDYSWDHRSQLTRVDFYNAPPAAASVPLKTIRYQYDTSGHRVARTLTEPGKPTDAETYVYDGDQLIAVLDGNGTARHQYFDGPALDQVFADQTALSGVLWPLEDRAGTVRDVIATDGTSRDHRMVNSFGAIISQSSTTTDYDQFFTGLSWDADAQLYYARARWYDPLIGRFINEDPLRFEGGDTNLSRYSLNDPVNRADPHGTFSFRRLVDKVGDAFEDTGEFFGEQWDNGNIQKGLLAAGTVATGGMFLPVAGALAGGGLAAAGITGGAAAYSTIAFASAGINALQGFSGHLVGGDGVLGRVLGAGAALTGGFFGAGFGSSVPGSWLSIADGMLSGYETGTGRAVGDGTLSGLLHLGNLGTNRGGAFFAGKTSFQDRFSIGLNLATGSASLVATGDRSLQNALRTLSITSHLWNTGTNFAYGAQQIRMTIAAAHTTNESYPSSRKESRGIRLVSYEEESDSDEEFEYGLRPLSAEEKLTRRIRERLRRGDPMVYAFVSEFDIRFGYRDDISASEFEHNLRDRSGIFTRSIHPEGTTEFEMLVWTQQKLRSNRTFRDFERVNREKIFGPNQGTIQPSKGTWAEEYSQKLAKQRYYQWMEEMGATPSEVGAKKWEDFYIDTFVPGGYFDTIVMSLSPAAARNAATDNRLKPRLTPGTTSTISNLERTSRGSELRSRYGHLSATERNARIIELSEANAERWVWELQSRLATSHPNLHPHFADKHGPDIPLHPNLARRSIDGSHPRTGVPGTFPQSSSQFIDWRTQMHALNDALSRQSRGLPPMNHFIDGNPNRPAVLGGFSGNTIGHGFTRNSLVPTAPVFHPDMDQYLVPLDRHTMMPYTAYPAKGL